MNVMNARLSHWVGRLGWPMLMGGLLTVSSLMFYGWVGLPTDQQLRALRQEAAQGSKNADMLRASWQPEDPARAINNFYRVLGPEKSIPDSLEKIFDAAYENNVGLDNGQFKLVRAQGASFSQYQIALPAVGSYADIRTFVNRVLMEIPAIALDGIDFTRPDVKSHEVEASVRFTLFLGNVK